MPDSHSSPRRVRATLVSLVSLAWFAPGVSVPAVALASVGVLLSACAAAPDAPPPVVQATTDPAVIARGRYLVHGPAHCAECHARPDAPAGAAALGGGRAFELGPLGTFVAANLGSDPRAGLGAWSDAQIADALLRGRARDGRRLAPLMEFQQLSVADARAIVSYLRTLPADPTPVPPSEPSLLGRIVLRLGLLPTPGPLPPDASTGRYLADAVANCDGCHTRRSYVTGRVTGRPYAGGMRLPDDDAEWTTPDVSATGAAGRLGDTEFVALFRARASHDAGSPMPWRAYARMTDDDLQAIRAHLAGAPER